MADPRPTRPDTEEHTPPTLEQLAAELAELRRQLAEGVETRQVTIVDTEGNPVAVLGYTDGSGPRLRLSSRTLDDQDAIAVELYAFHDDNTHAGVAVTARGEGVATLAGYEQNFDDGIGSQVDVSVLPAGATIGTTVHQLSASTDDIHHEPAVELQDVLRRRKAEMLADVLEHKGCDADTARLLEDEGWWRVALVAGLATNHQRLVMPSRATREQAIALLDERAAK